MNEGELSLNVLFALPGAEDICLRMRIKNLRGQIFATRALSGASLKMVLTSQKTVRLREPHT